MKPSLNEISCGQDREPLSQAERETVAKILSWDRRQHISPDEILFLWVDCDLVWVQMTQKRSVPIYVETFCDIRRKQMEGVELEDALLEPCFEVETFVDASGTIMYRLCKGSDFVGNFYQSSVDDKWLIQLNRELFSSESCKRWCTREQAQQSLIEGWGIYWTVHNVGVDYREKTGVQLDNQTLMNILEAIVKTWD